MKNDKDKIINLYCGFCNEHYPTKASEIDKDIIFLKLECGKCGHKLSIIKGETRLDRFLNTKIGSVIKQMTWLAVIIGILAVSLWAMYSGITYFNE